MKSDRSELRNGAKFLLEYGAKFLFEYKKLLLWKLAFYS